MLISIERMRNQLINVKDNIEEIDAIINEES